eukprot:CAMPEP_0119381556 /NCGR_PEP_ID=MMETSP1334-20130426/65645_1 /TAXON_ID=127549 /ORGANISM="Calcidiscus leptoporus, Strain RCC1130" /LENGTH=53 /DNA_ID=CAMNT_0007401735 /DNA_START=369 /DNA_END=530 /DNA_ORIENTATION=-
MTLMHHRTPHVLHSPPVQSPSPPVPPLRSLRLSQYRAARTAENGSAYTRFSLT